MFLAVVPSRVEPLAKSQVGPAAGDGNVTSPNMRNLFQS